MKVNFTHVALDVKNLDVSREFYENWCDMHVESQNKGSVWMVSPDENFVLVLAKPEPPEHEPVVKVKKKFNGTANIGHLGFSVDSYKELRQLEQRARQEGRLHRKIEHHNSPVGDLFMVRDPDGYIIEFSYGQPIGPKAKGPT